MVQGRLAVISLLNMPNGPQQFQIKIESVLGGHARTTHFGASGQFRASLGIDPGSPIQGAVNAPLTSSKYNIKPSGLIRPTPSFALNGTINQSPLFIRGARSTTTVFALGSNGSVYSIAAGANSFTALSDIGATTGDGNGMEYYDNYMYVATRTDIARYGPLDGVPKFTPNYLTGTLGLTALENNFYPVIALASGTGIGIPNHYLHRHSDGRLYIADTVGNQGYLHFIQTTKTTVEGDTNNGSTYQALRFGYGLVPICMESLGANLVIALYERDSTSSNTNAGLRGKSTRAKIAFWDTTSQNFNSITWVEFPDALITAMKNVNGTLYVFSAPSEGVDGFRVSRYVGGYTFEEVWSSEEGLSPLPGAVEGVASRLIFGSSTQIPKQSACIYSLGLAANGLSNGIFCPFASASSGDKMVSALMLPSSSTYGKGWDYPIFGTTNGQNAFTLEDPLASGGGISNAVWWSLLYRIGQRFKITKIRIPLTEPLNGNESIVPKIYTDDGFGTTYTLTTITSSNFGIKARTIIIHPQNLTGESNFWMELDWGGFYPLVPGLPITIEYELIPDD